MWLDGQLHDLNIQFLAGKDNWIKILGMTQEKGTLLKFDVEASESAAKLKISLASASIIYYHKSILEFVYWLEKAAEMSKAKPRQIFFGNASLIPRKVPKKPVDVYYEVYISNPYVIVPQESAIQGEAGESQIINQLEVDLGTITIKNTLIPLKQTRKNQKESDQKQKQRLASVVARTRARSCSTPKTSVSVESRRVIDGLVTRTAGRASVGTPGVRNPSQLPRLSDSRVTDLEDEKVHILDSISSEDSEDDDNGKEKGRSDNSEADLDFEFFRRTDIASPRKDTVSRTPSLPVIVIEQQEDKLQDEEKPEGFEVENEEEESPEDGIIIDRVDVSVASLAVRVRYQGVLYEFIPRTTATFLVDLPKGDPGHTLPEASVCSGS